MFVDMDFYMDKEDWMRIWAFVLLSCQNYAVFTTLDLIDPSVFFLKKIEMRIWAIVRFRANQEKIY